MSEIEMSHEDAVAALQAASAEDAVEQAPAPAPTEARAPVGAPEENVQQVEGQASDEVADEQPAEEPVVPFNPDELPPELVPAWKQLQREFTPRLQEAAAIRKQFEELGGVESIQQAVELQQWMSDPQNWPALYEEVYQLMEQSGFEFEDDQSPDAPQAPVADPFGDVTDPDIAPLANELKSLRDQTSNQQQLMEQFIAQQEFQRQMAEQELRQAQILAEMQRQVVGIRQSNPHYTDDDVKAIVELSSFYNDDLGLAQQRYEAIVSDRLNRYLASKGTAPASVQPPAGAGVLSEQESAPQTLREAEDEAVEWIRQLQAAGELDL